MPEGHTVHRTANHFNKNFAGELVAVTSPQGRFTDSVLINGSKLLSAKAVGKQLFLNTVGQRSLPPPHFLMTPTGQAPDPAMSGGSQLLICNQKVLMLVVSRGLMRRNKEPHLFCRHAN